MSFGRPPTIGDTFKLTPPQRGSFPLDHDGEICSGRRESVVLINYLLVLRRRMQRGDEGVPQMLEGERQQ
jgi:hypothetical protein